MIEIIPAIDLIDGQCVRLSQGDFSQSKIYSTDPVEVARGFESAGIRRLHVVDLDGARTGKLANIKVLESIARETRLIIDFGGGIKTSDDLRTVFDAGASIAAIGSIALKDPVRFFDWIAMYGSDHILLGADVRNGNLAIDGWQTLTRLEILPFLTEYFAAGVRRAFVTDIVRDGLLNGPATQLYREVRAAVPDLELIASGGVRSLADIAELEAAGCTGVIVGKAIYEGKIRLEELSASVAT